MLAAPVPPLFSGARRLRNGVVEKWRKGVLVRMRPTVPRFHTLILLIIVDY